MARRPIIAGNWKMHKTIAEAQALVRSLKGLVAPDEAAEIVLCPPFTALAAVKAELSGTGWGLGAQDLFWEEKGAFTGEVAPSMLVDAGCSHVIIGHSERRQYFGETDETVNRKVKAALAASLVPIVCVGESLEQRERGETETFVRGQVEAGLAGLSPDQVRSLVIAYEPIWAIGTGRNATGPDAGAVCRVIRQAIQSRSGEETAAEVRIQYGGSVKPDNIAEFMRQPDIDGALVGGASLDAAGFARLIAEARR
ncbi:MAG: triose-phosphate isomerase [Chitinophagales bacterium]